MKWIKCFCLLADLTFLQRVDCFESVAEVFVSGESWETLNGSLIEKRNCCNYFRSAGQQQSKVSRIVCPNNTCCWFLFVAAMNYEQQQQRNIIKGIVRTKIDVFFIQLLFLFHEWTIFLTLYWIRPAWHCVLDWAHFFQMKPFNIHGQTSVSL